MAESKEKKKIMCEVCGIHEVAQKDYRFIDSCGFQGKVLSCQWCAGLNDVAISDIVRNRGTKDAIDPLGTYTWDKPVEFSATVVLSAFTGNHIKATSKSDYIYKLQDSFEDEFGIELDESEITNIKVKGLK